jgi:aminoglycoside N3'-acetyltransferase
MHGPATTTSVIRSAIQELTLEGKPVCLHASLRSFGRVEGSASAVVDAFLLEGCTLLVPAFCCRTYSVPPPVHLRFRRNATDYEALAEISMNSDRIYDPATCEEIDENMGAISAEVVSREGRSRGNHPLCSFAAVGPLAGLLVAGQEADNAFAPFETLAQLGGTVVLAGVTLRKMTMIHLAEKRAGRVLFRGWANGQDGQPVAVEGGACSAGFPRLASALSPLLREAEVGESPWRVYPAADTLRIAAQAIKDDPRITHCGKEPCPRCDDLIAGGPVLG